MGPKEKIRQYINYKGITVYEFEKMTGIGHGVMGKGKDFGVSLLSKIKRNISDLNMDWLIYDEGSMILEDDDLVMESANYAMQPEEEYFKSKEECRHLEAIIKAKDETIAILKHQLGIDKDSSKAS